MSICRRGELSAAYDALASALGVFTPFLGRIYTLTFNDFLRMLSSRLHSGQATLYRRSYLRLCSCLVLRACPTEELYIDDEGGTHDGSTRASASTIDEEIRQLYNNNDTKRMRQNYGNSMKTNRKMLCTIYATGRRWGSPAHAYHSQSASTGSRVTHPT